MLFDRFIGIGLVLYTNDNKICILRELKGKDWLGKKAGDYSIPMETAAKNESIRAVIVRLLREELGLEEDQIDWNTLAPLKRTNVGKHAVLFTFQALCPMELNISPEDNDVIFAGWLKPKESLHRNMRDGSKPSIQAFIAPEYYVGDDFPLLHDTVEYPANLKPPTA